MLYQIIDTDTFFSFFSFKVYKFCTNILWMKMLVNFDFKGIVHHLCRAAPFSVAATTTFVYSSISFLSCNNHIGTPQQFFSWLKPQQLCTAAIMSFAAITSSVYSIIVFNGCNNNICVKQQYLLLLQQQHLCTAASLSLAATTTSVNLSRVFLC